ncbi:MAG: hypothetical protein EOP06_11735 [Proteobacteria bacterium]|nr:MAG: hypothetical protein EOP06_11735 [Pseudomonadota bacterium]
MTTLRDILTSVAYSYAAEAKSHGAPSLARVATIVVNRGSFFTRIETGGGCSLQNFERVMRWFAQEEVLVAVGKIYSRIVR